MTRTRTAALSFAALTALAGGLITAAPAHAAPWDGNEIPYTPGTWDGSFSDFKLQNVFIELPGPTLADSNMWDDAGVTRMTSTGLGIDDVTPACADIAAVDVQNPEAGTGDLVLSCPNAVQELIDAGLDIEQEIRVLAGGDVVRFMTSITNTTGSTVTIDRMRNWVNYGGVGQLWDYDGQSDGILAVPAPDNTDRSDALNAADALWAVHWHPTQAPGSWVVGNEYASTSGVWDFAIADFMDYHFGAFDIPAGETRRLVVFSVWSPDELIAGGWNGVDASEAANSASADAIVEKILAIRDLSGVYANGIADVAEVVNWGPAPAIVEPEEPELADTGAGDVSAAVLFGMLLLGLGGVLVARRRAGALA